VSFWIHILGSEYSLVMALRKGRLLGVGEHLLKEESAQVGFGGQPFCIVMLGSLGEIDSRMAIE
jgi:hypothetical protein